MLEICRTTGVRRWLLPTSLLLLAVMSAASGSATVFRVDGVSGSDAGGCGAVGSPCASVQKAVNQAGNGDTILVAEGTYTYQAALDPCGVETGVVCIVEKKLKLRGGFSPPDWSTSDPAAHPTIIDGENLFRGVLVQKTFPGSAANASLTLEGFTLRRGKVTGTSGRPDAFGGGLMANLVESVTLRDLVVENCSVVGADVSSSAGGRAAGGGVFINTVLPQLPPVQATLVRVRFVGNQAVGGDTNSNDRGGLGLGGGLFVTQSVVRGVELSFESNTAQGGNSTGGGITGGLRAEGLGGGMAILQGTTVTLEGFSAIGNTVLGGSASSSGGTGGTGAGGGLYVEGSSVVVQDGHLQGNSSTGGAADSGGIGTGGGITSFDADVSLDGVALINNQATGGDGIAQKGSVGGGGAYLERALDPTVSVSIINSIVADNRVSLGTGDVSPGGGGGGIFVLGNDATIVHSTFARNVLGTSGVVGQAVVVVPRLGSPSHATLQDSVIADHTSLTNRAAVQAQNQGSSVTFVNGLFAGNDRDTNDGSPGSGTFSGLATMDSAMSVVFASPGAPDFDYHLTASSPALDQATSSSVELDFDRTRRGTPRDWGADEYCFALTDQLALSGETVNNTRIEAACREISADSYTVKGSGNVTLRAGLRIVLGAGFSVESGGRLVVDAHLP